MELELPEVPSVEDRMTSGGLEEILKMSLESELEIWNLKNIDEKIRGNRILEEIYEVYLEKRKNNQQAFQYILALYTGSRIWIWKSPKGMLIRRILQAIHRKYGISDDNIVHWAKIFIAFYLRWYGLAASSDYNFQRILGNIRDKGMEYSTELLKYSIKKFAERKFKDEKISLTDEEATILAMGEIFRSVINEYKKIIGRMSREEMDRELLKMLEDINTIRNNPHELFSFPIYFVGIHMLFERLYNIKRSLDSNKLLSVLSNLDEVLEEKSFRKILRDVKGIEILENFDKELYNSVFFLLIYKAAKELKPGQQSDLFGGYYIRISYEENEGGLKRVLYVCKRSACEKYKIPENIDEKIREFEREISDRIWKIKKYTKTLKGKIEEGFRELYKLAVSYSLWDFESIKNVKVEKIIDMYREFLSEKTRKIIAFGNNSSNSF